MTVSGTCGSTGGLDPVARLFSQLPPLWRGPIIGPGIEDWASISENGERRIDLTGLPDPFPAELAWMAHWQALDGTRSSVLATNQLANILRRAVREQPPVPGLDARRWTGTPRRRCRAGSTPPDGDGSHPRAAAPGCGSCSASPAWPCSPAATTARGGRWTTGTRAATPGSR